MPGPEKFRRPSIHEDMHPPERHLRENSEEYLKTALSLRWIPGQPTGEYKAFSGGETSAVYQVGTSEGEYVVKMTVSDAAVVEARAFRLWKEEGVKTPETIAVHNAREDSRIPAALSVMEYIDAPELGDVMKSDQLVESGTAYEMGATLAKMHRVTGRGFGELTDPNKLQGKHSAIAEEQRQKELRSQYLNLLKAGLVTDVDIGKISDAINVLQEDISFGRKPSLTHGDFRPYNILATQPITVIDAEPKLTHPYLDLSLTILKAQLIEGKKEKDEILKGYSDISPINERVLTAAIIIKAAQKLNAWHRKPRKIDRTKHLLSLYKQLIAE